MKKMFKRFPKIDTKTRTMIYLSITGMAYIPLGPPSGHHLSAVESQDEVEGNHGGVLETVLADLLEWLVG